MPGVVLIIFQNYDKTTKVHRETNSSYVVSLECQGLPRCAWAAPVESMLHADEFVQAVDSLPGQPRAAEGVFQDSRQNNLLTYVRFVRMLEAWHFAFSGPRAQAEATRGHGAYGTPSASPMPPCNKCIYILSRTRATHGT